MKEKILSLLRCRLDRYDALLLTALAGLAAYALLLIHGLAWPAKLLPVTPGSSYFDWHDYHTIYNPRSSFWRGLAALGYLASASVIGYKFCFSGTLAREQKERYGLLLGLLAFIPGYLIAVAVNRLTTLLLPNQLALPLLGTAYAAALVYGIYSVARQRGRRAFAGASAAVLVCAVFLVDGLQKSNSHILGDGATYFLNLISSGSIFAAARHFPLFSQHYDEIMFMYPLYPLLKHPGTLNLYLPFLLLYAAGKAAAITALVLVLRAVSGSLLFAGLLSVYVFFGTPYPIPGSQLLLFDSGNPVNHVLHTGRVFGILIPLLLAAGLRAKRLFPPPSARQYAGLGLAAAGLSASTMSNFYAVLAAGVCCLLLKAHAAESPFAGARRAFYPALAAAIALTAAAPLLLAGPLPAFRHAGAAALLLAIIAFAAAALTAPAAPPEDAEQVRFACKAALVIAVCYGAGIVLLGNLLIPRTIGLFGDLEMLGRSVQDPLSGSVLNMYGPDSFCGTFPLMHCVDTRGYLERFGLMYAALLLGAVMFGKRLLAGERAAGVEDLRIPALAVFTLGGVFLYEYTNGLLTGGEQYWAIWFKSRMVEPWFYGAILLCFSYVYSAAGRPLRWALTAWTAGAVGFEFIYNYWAGGTPQFLINLKTAGKLLYFF